MINHTYIKKFRILKLGLDLVFTKNIFKELENNY